MDEFDEYADISEYSDASAAGHDIADDVEKFFKLDTPLSMPPEGSPQLKADQHATLSSFPKFDLADLGEISLSAFPLDKHLDLKIGVMQEEMALLPRLDAFSYVETDTAMAVARMIVAQAEQKSESVTPPITPPPPSPSPSAASQTDNFVTPKKRPFVPAIVAEKSTRKFPEKAKRRRSSSPLQKCCVGDYVLWKTDACEAHGEKSVSAGAIVVGRHQLTKEVAIVPLPRRNKKASDDESDSPVCSETECTQFVHYVSNAEVNVISPDTFRNRKLKKSSSTPAKRLKISQTRAVVPEYDHLVFPRYLLGPVQMNLVYKPTAPLPVSCESIMHPDWMEQLETETTVMLQTMFTRLHIVPLIHKVISADAKSRTIRIGAYLSITDEFRDELDVNQLSWTIKLFQYVACVQSPVKSLETPQSGILFLAQESKERQHGSSQQIVYTDKVVVEECVRAHTAQIDNASEAQTWMVSRERRNDIGSRYWFEVDDAYTFHGRLEDSVVDCHQVSLRYSPFLNRVVSKPVAAKSLGQTGGLIHIVSNSKSSKTKNANLFMRQVIVPLVFDAAKCTSDQPIDTMIVVSEERWNHWMQALVERSQSVVSSETKSAPAAPENCLHFCNNHKEFKSLMAKIGFTASNTTRSGAAQVKTKRNIVLLMDSVLRRLKDGQLRAFHTTRLIVDPVDMVLDLPINKIQASKRWFLHSSADIPNTSIWLDMLNKQSQLPDMLCFSAPVVEAGGYGDLSITEARRGEIRRGFQPFIQHHTMRFEIRSD